MVFQERIAVTGAKNLVAPGFLELLGHLCVCPLQKLRTNN